jgi:hypothetical protein
VEVLACREMLSTTSSTPPPMSSSAITKSLLNQLQNTAFAVTTQAFTQHVSDALANASQSVGNPNISVAALLSLLESDGLVSPTAVPTTTPDVATAGTVLQQLSQSALLSASQVVGSIGPIAGVFAGNALASGFNGLNSSQQAQILGQAALQTVETGLDAIPVVGDVAAELLDLGAATQVGQQAVNAVGTALENAYQAFLGGAGGGSSHDSRVAALYAGTVQRVTQLQSGGVLTTNDVAGFNQAVAYGIIYVDGFNLSQLTFAAGTNPFLPQVDPLDTVTHFLVQSRDSTVSTIVSGLNITVTALDANNNPVSNYDGMALLTTTDPLMAPVTINFSNGIGYMTSSQAAGTNFGTTGIQTLTVTTLNCALTNNGSAAFTAVTGSTSVNVIAYNPVPLPPPPTVTLQIAAPSTVTAGTPIGITATPVNASGAIVATGGVTGTIYQEASLAAALQDMAVTNGHLTGAKIWTNTTGTQFYSQPPYAFGTPVLTTTGYYVLLIATQNHINVTTPLARAEMLISVIPGAPAQVVWANPPTSLTATSGVAQPTVVNIPSATFYLEDAYGNVVTTDSTDRAYLSAHSNSRIFTTTNATFNQGMATINNFTATVSQTAPTAFHQINWTLGIEISTTAIGVVNDSYFYQGVASY